MFLEYQNAMYFLLNVAIVSTLLIIGIGAMAYYDTRKQTRQLKNQYPIAYTRKPQPRWRTWLLKFKII